MNEEIKFTIITKSYLKSNKKRYIIYNYNVGNQLKSLINTYCRMYIMHLKTLLFNCEGMELRI